jgi:hypothetical protein
MVGEIRPRFSCYPSSSPLWVLSAPWRVKMGHCSPFVVQQELEQSCEYDHYASISPVNKWILFFYWCKDIQSYVLHEIPFDWKDVVLYMIGSWSWQILFQFSELLLHGDLMIQDKVGHEWINDFGKLIQLLLVGHWLGGLGASRVLIWSSLLRTWSFSSWLKNNENHDMKLHLFIIVSLKGVKHVMIEWNWMRHLMKIIWWARVVPITMTTTKC